MTPVGTPWRFPIRTTAILLALLVSLVMIGAPPRYAPASASACATERHYFPETRTTWLRLTCPDGAVHWVLR